VASVKGGFEMRGQTLAVLASLGVATVMAASAMAADIVVESPEELQKLGTVSVKSKASLLHLGSIDSFDITDGGKRAAKRLMAAVEEKDLLFARSAQSLYEKLIPAENFGGEYSALQWFCEYLSSTNEQQKAEMLSDPFNKSYFDFFADNDYAVLKEYLNRKYRMERIQDADPEQGQRRMAFLEDFILFNNPRRETWEKTTKIIETVKLQKGETVADVGSGPGYYSFMFSRLVGDTGKIYAIDLNEQHLEYINATAKKLDVKNIETVASKMNDICVSNQVDVAFLCSLYHIIYSTSIEKVKDDFVASIKRALKPDGRLVIVDNALIEDANLPYHGPYIAKELIVAQMKYYGFELTGYYQFIPQRYILVFKQTPAAK
jgi:ubiquinone/menaquinone biosynthesis C-methylase UbiE